MDDARPTPHTITTDRFAETVQRGGIVLIDFWADWCQPCRTFAPVFEAAAGRHPEVYFGKIDTEAEGELSAALGIRSIPTLLAFRDGVLLFRHSGTIPGTVLDELISKLAELDMDEVRASISEAESKPES